MTAPVVGPDANTLTSVFSLVRDIEAEGAQVTLNETFAMLNPPYNVRSAGFASVPICVSDGIATRVTFPVVASRTNRKKVLVVCAFVFDVVVMLAQHTSYHNVSKSVLANRQQPLVHCRCIDRRPITGNTVKVRNA